MNMIEAIVFDFYSVVTKENWSDGMARELSKRLGQDTQEIKRVFKKYLLPFTSAKLSPSEFLERFIGSLDKKRNPSDFRYVFDIIPELNHDMLELILRLRKNHKTALFSGNFKPVFPNFRKKFNPDDYFDYIFLTYELKLAKVDDKIWGVILEKMGLAPDQVLFVDDREIYNEFAEKHGINTILFRDIEQFKKELVRHGIKP